MLNYNTGQEIGIMAAQNVGLQNRKPISRQTLENDK